jgi:hypothetical protein
VDYYHPGFADQVKGGRSLEDLFGEETPIDGYLVSYAFKDQFLRKWKRDMGKARSHYDKHRLKILADSGAFSFVNEQTPPISVNDVIDFQNHIDADLGVSLDHIIPDYDAGYDYFFGGIPKPPMFKERMNITIENGEAYLKECKAQGVRFTPIGALQGYSPESYLDCLRAFQKMGYKRVALGGIAKLHTNHILEILSALKPHIGETQLHLLGVVRPHLLRKAKMSQITSVDGMGPFLVSMTNRGRSYYLEDRFWQILPISEVAQLDRLMGGDMELFDDVLGSAPELNLPRDVRDKELKETLLERVWERCACKACLEAGWRILLTDPKYNRLRGFHNVFAFKKALKES